MHARVVRFTGVPQETIDRMRSEIEGEGPPQGTNPKSVKVYYDADQQTSVVLIAFESAEDLAAADPVFDQMDPGDTPGTRASVDRTELVIEQQM